MIYFIKGEITGRVKIGTSRQSVNERLKQFQMYSPDSLVVLLEVEGGYEEEKIIKRYLKNYVVHGEWFELTKEVIGLINRIKRNGKRIPNDLIFHRIESVPKKYRKGISTLPVGLSKIIKTMAKEKGIKPSEMFTEIIQTGMKRLKIGENE